MPPLLSPTALTPDDEGRILNQFLIADLVDALDVLAQHAAFLLSDLVYGELIFTAHQMMRQADGQTAVFIAMKRRMVQLARRYGIERGRELFTYESTQRGDEIIFVALYDMAMLDPGYIVPQLVEMQAQHMKTTTSLVLLEQLTEWLNITETFVQRDYLAAHLDIIDGRTPGSIDAVQAAHQQEPALLEGVRDSISTSIDGVRAR